MKRKINSPLEDCSFSNRYYATFLVKICNFLYLNRLDSLAKISPMLKPDKRLIKS